MYVDGVKSEYITLELHRLKYDALERELAREGCHVEERLQDTLDQLYCEMVPYAQRSQIECHTNDDMEDAHTKSLEKAFKQIEQALESQERVKFQKPLEIPVSEESVIICENFLQVADAMQRTRHMNLEIGEDTQNLLTALIDSGSITIWQAYSLCKDFEIDGEGRESLSWPCPKDALECLGFSEYAEQLQLQAPVPLWEQQM